MHFVSQLMCQCFLQGEINYVHAAWWVYKNANRQLWKMIRHPAFCHSGQSQHRSSQEYAMMAQKVMVFCAVCFKGIKGFMRLSMTIKEAYPTFQLRNVLQDDLPCCKLAENSRPQLTSLVICGGNRFIQRSNMSRWKRWFLQLIYDKMKTRHKNTMQDLEVRDGQELLWTSRPGSFNSFLEMQMLGRWDMFSCKHLSSFATAKVFMLQNKVIFWKPQPVFSRHWMQIEDMTYQKGIVRTKGFQLSQKFWGLNPVNSWREQHENTQRRPVVWSRKVQFQNLGPYEFMSYSVHLLLNSDFVCCFALLVLSTKKDWYVCMTSPIVQRTSD